MNAISQLDQNINVLARDHRATHTDPITRKTSYPTEFGLLQQLRLETASGTRRGAQSGSGSRSPIALAAVVLWSEIQETLNTAMISITGRDHPELAAETKLIAWNDAAVRAGEPVVGKCVKTTDKWIKDITELLNPEPSIDIKGQCPECHEHHSVLTQDGEKLLNTALTATLLEAKCRNCGASWARQDFAALAESVK